MSIYLDEEKCTGCGICVSSCPEQAITIENDLAIINQQKCTDCLQCMYDCPLDAIYQVLDKETSSIQNDYSASPAVQDKPYSPPSTPQSEERIQKAFSIGESLIKGIKSVIQYFGSPDSFSRRGMRAGGRGGGNKKRRRRGRK